MSKKKGFVLIETIITISLLSISLLYIYSSFNNVLIKEKSRVNYDDVAYIYRAHHVKEFFKDYDLGFVLNLLDEENPLIIIGCDYEGMFDENSSAKNLCNSLKANLGFQNVAVGLKDLSYIKECNDESAEPKCLYLNNFSLEEEAYLKTLGNIETASNYVMLFEFEEEVSTEKKERNYSWIGI